MRRFLALLITVLLILTLTVPCYAANSASQATINAAVHANGSCQITTDLQIRITSAVDSLYFPLPKTARSVSVNGSTARTHRSGDYLEVNLSSLVRGAIGDFSLRIQYTLPNTVDYNELDKLQLQLPLLSGFLFPVEQLSFTVNLPGENTVKPAFISGYYQQSIESDMYFTANGSTISGSVLSPLKDRETLAMTLEVSEEMFPQDPIKQWSVGVEDILMIVLAVLALLYWLIFLRSAPLLRQRTSDAPQGLAAGSLGSTLTGQGADLTLLVFSWAQLGYLLIQVQEGDRVKLHKRMDMGNERSAFEVRIFRALFGRRTVVEGTSLPYALMCRKVSASAPDIRELYKKGNGNYRFLRLLCAAIGICSGISTGIAIAGDALLGVLLIAVLAVAGGAAAWFMQLWWKGLHLHRTDLLVLGLSLAALWSLLGFISGEGAVNLYATLAQLLCGLLWAYGGRRTITGHQSAGQVLGLRSYLCRLSHADAQRLTLSDPEYFFDMAPYAMALGVLQPFARRFGKTKLGPCPYLTTGLDGQMTAAQWSKRMLTAAKTLDARQRRMPLDRLLGR